MKKIIEIIKKYFTIWWIPIIFHFLIIGIFFLGTILRRDWIIDLSLTLFFINVIGNIISSIVQIVIKKWYFIFPQLLLTAFLFYYTIIIFTFSPPDYYGAHKEIPYGIQIYEPNEENSNLKELDEFDLIISGWGGNYNYYTDFDIKEKGFFYIKAYELTSNDRLSETRIKEQSKIQVNNFNRKIYEKRFTIYEGEWGDKYGSRIELWFQPSNDKKEYKITERNYIIEGWMR